jgi:hypothetical protein
MSQGLNLTIEDHTLIDPPIVRHLASYYCFDLMAEKPYRDVVSIQIESKPFLIGALRGEETLFMLVKRRVMFNHMPYDPLYFNHNIIHIFIITYII